MAGYGSAGLIVGKIGGVATAEVRGIYMPSGGFASSAGGGTCFVYFIVANDATASTHTSPMQILSACGTSSNVVPWPRVASGTDTITYDVLRVVAGAATYPGTFANCGGGTVNACGSVTPALSQATACGSSLTCSYTDSALGSNTTSYNGVTVGNYIGPLNFWPGTVVSINHTIQADKDQANTTGIGMAGLPVIHARDCINYGPTTSDG